MVVVVVVVMETVLVLETALVLGVVVVAVVVVVGVVVMDTKLIIVNSLLSHLSMHGIGGSGSGSDGICVGSSD